MQVYSCQENGLDHHTGYHNYVFIESLTPSACICLLIDRLSTAEPNGSIKKKLDLLLQNIVHEKKQHQPNDLRTKHPGVILREILEVIYIELNIFFHPDSTSSKPFSSFTLAVFDEEMNKGALLGVGESILGINGKLMQFTADSNTIPVISTPGTFDTWFEHHQQKIALSTIQDISIASNGILTFQRINQHTAEINPVTFLLTDQPQENEPDMLSVRLRSLAEKYSLFPADDIAIVRILFNKVIT
ncbi:MAG: hypothetical protein ABW007_19575 [Chitinophagaceae bacterium]